MKILKLENNLTFKQFLPAIIWFIVVMAIICMPKQDLPDVADWFHPIYFDKWVHAGMFGVLTFLTIFPFYKGLLNRKKLLTVIIIIACATSCWGLITEYIQLYVPGRSFDLLDWAADSLGVLLAALYYAIKK